MSSGCQAVLQTNKMKFDIKNKKISAACAYLYCTICYGNQFGEAATFFGNNQFPFKSLNPIFWCLTDHFNIEMCLTIRKKNQILDTTSNHLTQKPLIVARHKIFINGTLRTVKSIRIWCENVNKSGSDNQILDAYILEYWNIYYDSLFELYVV